MVNLLLAMAFLRGLEVRGSNADVPARMGVGYFHWCALLVCTSIPSPGVATE